MARADRRRAAARSRMLAPEDRPPRQRSRSHRGHPLLHADPPAREVGVRVPRPLFRSASSVFNVGGGRTAAHRRAYPRQQRLHERQHLSLGRARAGAEEPEERASQRNLATALQEDGQTDEAIVALNATWSCSRRTRTRCASSPASTSGRATSSPRRHSSPSCARATTPSAPRSLAARPRQRRDDRAGPDRPGDRDPGQRGGQHAYSKAQPPSRAQSRPTRSSSCSRRRTRTSNWSSPRRRSRAGTRHRDRRISGFLELAPDDPSAAIVKQQIAQLKAAQARPRRVRLTPYREDNPIL